MKIKRFYEVNRNQASDNGLNCWVLIFMEDRCVSDVYVFTNEEDANNFLINHINEENNEGLVFTNAKEAEDWWDENGPDGATIEFREVTITNEKVPTWDQLKKQHRFDL